MHAHPPPTIFHSKPLNSFKQWRDTLWQNITLLSMKMSSIWMCPALAVTNVVMVMNTYQLHSWTAALWLGSGRPPCHYSIWLHHHHTPSGSPPSLQMLLRSWMTQKMDAQVCNKRINMWAQGGISLKQLSLMSIHLLACLHKITAFLAKLQQK
jgi:hypothetical protein